MKQFTPDQQLISDQIEHLLEEFCKITDMPEDTKSSKWLWYSKLAYQNEVVRKYGNVDANRRVNHRRS